jgi:quercetin dioxygenase-like cupin family protein
MKSHLHLVLASSLLAACAIDSTSEVEQETLGSGAVATTLANASLGEAKTEVFWGPYRSEVKGATTLVMQEIVIQPGGHTGWHSHSGLAFASIVTGTLTLFDAEDPCEGTDYPAGTAFVDPGGNHVHIARNLTAAPMTVRVQYVTPTGEPVRIDAPAPDHCP